MTQALEPTVFCFPALQESGRLRTWAVPPGRCRWLSARGFPAAVTTGPGVPRLQWVRALAGCGRGLHGSPSHHYVLPGALFYPSWPEQDWLARGYRL